MQSELPHSNMYWLKGGGVCGRRRVRDAGGWNFLFDHNVSNCGDSRYMSVQCGQTSRVGVLMEVWNSVNLIITRSMPVAEGGLSSYSSGKGKNHEGNGGLSCCELGWWFFSSTEKFLHLTMEISSFLAVGFSIPGSKLCDYVLVPTGLIYVAGKEVIIPQEEVDKFMATYNDVEAQKPANWKEGEGLGSSRSGIADPIMGGNVKNDNLGVGASQPDPLGIQGRKVKVSGTDACLQVWVGPLSGTRFAVVLWNRCLEDGTINVSWDSLGLQSFVSVSVRDLWKRGWRQKTKVKIVFIDE
ncbi:hypothetical protein L2E82_31483 [Cichorium intybus]|uniref:Uncharacterized protein n=1 Tax=Cichorium intybus TaxID=13427 RepID=A0ACB9BFC6_CICIN|nr:hypothetical protein L2E82_31483 [Cichorium intybus]